MKGLRVGARVLFWRVARTFCAPIVFTYFQGFSRDFVRLSKKTTLHANWGAAPGSGVAATHAALTWGDLTL